MAQVDRERPMTLNALPNELLLRIAALLAPRDLLSLGSASRELLATMRSDAVWLPIVKAICDLAPPPASRNLLHDLDDEIASKTRQRLSWFEKARFLCPRARRLGFFATSSAYVSRIVYVYVELLPGACVIRAEQLIPRNMYKESPVSPVVPAGARLGLDRTSYDLPAAAPSPDAGLSFDLLDYDSMFLPLFRIDPFKGARFAGPSTSSNGELRLRLRASETDIALDPDITSGYEEGDSAQPRGDRNIRNLWSLFTGRGPARKWPTSGLAGGRGSAALRPEYDGMTICATELRPTSTERAPASTFRARGFHLQVLQKVRQDTPPSTFGTYSHAEAQRALDSLDRPRSTGRPDILYDGQREDPADRDRVTIIQAGGGHALGIGGMTFRLPHAPSRSDEQNELGDETEEVLRTEREDFYPIKKPTCLSGLLRASLVDGAGDVRADSLDGVWVGTYGPHGLELGYVSVCYEDGPGADSSNRTRLLQFVKITGDQNVPSGELSWEAVLGGSEPSNNNEEGGEMGTVTSVHADDLLRWSSLSTAYEDEQRLLNVSSAGMNGRWSAGRYPARGRFAMTGFVQPGWMEATATLVRNTIHLDPEAEIDVDVDGRVRGEDTSERSVEVVNEIRVAWPAMGKVSVFKRVEIDFEKPRVRLSDDDDDDSMARRR